MKEISIRSFQRSFCALRGEEVAVTHRGRIVGRWVPIEMSDKFIVSDNPKGVGQS